MYSTTMALEDGVEDINDGDGVKDGVTSYLPLLPAGSSAEAR